MHVKVIIRFTYIQIYFHNLDNMGFKFANILFNKK